MEKKTGVSRSSASEGYIMKENMELWSHVQKNRVNNLEEGIQQLRSVFSPLNLVHYLNFEQNKFNAFLLLIIEIERVSK